MLDTKNCATSHKLCFFELSFIVCQDSSGHAKSVYKLCENLTTAFYVIFTTGIASIHLVKVSMVTNKNLNPLGALGKMPTMLIPQIAKGQERSICQRGFACFDVCF
jgi:hypothetical protein